MARPLLALAPAFRRQLKRDGLVVLSGLTTNQARPVEARYRAFGFHCVRRFEIDGWATHLLMRR